MTALSAGLAPIRTKLNPPHYLQEAMPRPRLTNLGDTVLNSKIFSIVAAPGFGKSTLLAQLHKQLSSSAAKLAWLNIDADDNDPITMTEYLFVAFNQFDSSIAKRSLQILKSGSLLSLKELYVALIEDILQSKKRFILFVDDFHLLQKGESLKLWQWFVEHLPEQVTLVIASRKTLPLALKRLQLSEQYRCLSPQDLQFTYSEVQDFFLQYHRCQVSEALLRSVYEKTEGWAGALQMLFLSMQQKSNTQALVENFSGSHKDIMEYLSEVVLQQIPNDLKNFMLSVSILDRICGPLAEKLSGQNQAQESLEEIDRRHLFFIPLDDEKRWYRFHHLFQDFLRRQAAKLLGGKTLYEKYREASLWFEQNGYHHEAIHYALTGKDYLRAAELISAFAMLLFQNQGDYRTMLHWMKQLPEKYVALFPMIRISYSISLTFTNHFRESHIELEKLKAQIHNFPLEIANDLMSMIEINEVMIASFQDKIMLSRQRSTEWLKKYNQTTVAAHGFALNIRGVGFFFTSSFQQGIEDLNKAASIFQSNQAYYAYIWPLTGLVGLHWIHGKFNQALEHYQVVLDNIHQYHGDNFHMEKIIDVGISDVYYERGDFEKTLSLIRDKKIYIYTFSGTDPKIVYYNVRIRMKLLEQEFNQAAEYLNEGEKWAQKLEYPRFQDHMFLLKIELYLQSRRIEEAKHLLQSRGWSQPEEPADEIEDTNAMIRNIFARLAISRLLLAEKKYAEAAQKLASLIPLLQKIDLMRHLLSAVILAALCDENLKQHDRALQKMKSALELATPEGFISVFLEYGDKFNSQVYALLKKIDTQEAKALKLRNQILRHLEAYFEQSKKDRDDGIKLLDKISSREIEILSTLDSPKTSIQIAKALHISLGTLKWHLHNIYQKLDVKSRSGALIKAKQLELI